MFDTRGGGAGRGGRDRAAVVADLRRRLADLGGLRPESGGASDDGARVGGVGGYGGASVLGDGYDEVLPVPDPLAALLPAAGLPRGCVVGVGSQVAGSSGAASLLLTLLAAQRGRWLAVVGLPRLSPLAAAEMGVDLSRLALIPDPGPDPVRVLSILADGVGVIAAAVPADLPPARVRVLTGRLRGSGAVLLAAGRWPGADLVFTVTDVRWSGVGRGYGRLRDREMDVRVSGRRAAGGGSATLVLQADHGSVTIRDAVGTVGTRMGEYVPVARHASA